MDYGPCIVHLAKHHADLAFRKTEGSQYMCQATDVELSWRILMVKLLHHGQSDTDPQDHGVEHAGP